MKRKLDLLLSPGFIVALLLLLANDFLFKPVFQNDLTGKLSDFAGLFAFALFWTALFPRHRKAIHVSVAVGFTFWKSDLSQPMIDMWNVLPLFKVARIIDYSDLLALSVLPVAYRYCKTKPRSVWSFRFAPQMIAVVAVFAFTATSRVDEQSFTPRRVYRFNMSKAELLERLNQLPRVRVKHNTFLSEDYYDITLDFKFCTSDSLYSHVEIYTRANAAEMELRSVQYYCRNGDEDQHRQVLEIFEREVTAHFNPEVLVPEPLPPLPSPSQTTMPMLNSSPEQR